MPTAKRPKRGGTGPPKGLPTPTDKRGKLSVLVEVRHHPGGSGSFAMDVARGINSKGFSVDEEYEPISLVLTGDDMAPQDETYVVRGVVDGEKDLEKLRARPDVEGVWIDTPIAPFPSLSDAQPEPVESPAMAPCPIPPCDCDPRTPKGTIADVANYLGVNNIWSAGIRGTGIVVGVLDSGITAQGRPVKPNETSRRIPRVIGGWPSDWGTESGKWGEHGNMCATDVLGMAPDAQLYDLRIAGAGGSPGTISRALQAFNWAISRHRTNGTPQVLTNSWGIFQETWDSTYARNPNHPFTRKVVEAINEGILVLFAAGNCGDTCPDSRCGSDVGPGKSIWGANGHPLVMTVGAVNINEKFIGYSSRGPAALDPNKPDFCSISHFRGYFNSDSGTSAATPILAGVVALLKQAKSNATQNQIKSALKVTAKDIGPTGFDQHSGAGIVQAFAAYRRLTQPTIRTLTPTCRTLTPTCRRTIAPICRPTRLPICRPTRVPVCRPTRVPLCRPTRVPPCRTLRPPCRPTRVPPCRPTRVPPCRPTRVPLCRPTRVPLCRPTRVPLCRPTRVPPCRPTRVPPCRPTVIPPCRTLRPPCPRPTLPPRCPRPTLTPRCPRPTLIRCPRPTLTRCPRPTLTRCPRPTLARCPRPTLVCGRPPIVPPPFAADYPYEEEDWYEDYEYEDPYGWDEYGEYEEEDWDSYEMEDWDDEYGYSDPYMDDEYYDEEFDEEGYEDEDWDYEDPYEEWTDEDDYY